MSLLLSLHFMMMKHDLSKNPGRWRPGAIWVGDQDGREVHRAPDRDDIEPLVAALLDQVNRGGGDVIVRAAMAHLNLTMIHPFGDGNGRMARCLQPLVLASDGIVSPEFSSIEEYLGRNTADYYAVLAGIGQGQWSPERSARPWVRFCLTAHYRQAQTILRRVHETEVLWDRCEQLVARHRLPARSVSALYDAARGWRVRRSLYIKLVASGIGEAINQATATRDLRAIVDAGLLAAHGERRGRSYRRTAVLAEAWEAVRAERPAGPEEDPYLTLVQPRLPGFGAG